MAPASGGRVWATHAASKHWQRRAWSLPLRACALFVTTEMVMAAHQFNRRSSDQAEQPEIESLIAAEDDPKMRLQLMIMNRINLSLIANTHTINEIATKLENHLSLYEQRTTAEQALLNKGKGAWRVVAWVIGAVQVIGLGIWADARSDLASIHTALEQSRISDVRMEQRLTALEQKK